MLEHTIEHNGKVLVSRPVDRSQHVRWRGEDVAAGTELLHAGRVVTAGQIADHQVFAAVGPAVQAP